MTQYMYQFQVTGPPDREIIKKGQELTQILEIVLRESPEWEVFAVVPMNGELAAFIRRPLD